MDQAQFISDLDCLVRNMQQALQTLQEAKDPLNATAAQVALTKEHLGDLGRLTEQGAHAILTVIESLQENEVKVQQELAQCRTAEHAERLDRVERLLVENQRQFLEVFTALSFQDLVAQRLLKVSAILNDFEHKLLQLMMLFGLDRQQGVAFGLDNSQAGRMLKQLDASKKSALRQAVIDDLLAEYRFSSEIDL